MRHLILGLLILGSSSSFAKETTIGSFLSESTTKKSTFNFNEMLSRSRYWGSKVKASKNEDELTTNLNGWFLESLSRIRGSLIFDQFPEEFQNEIKFLQTKASHPAFDYYGCPRQSTVAYTDGNSITFCDQFFKDSRTVGENFNTIIHEYIHMLGYDHGVSHSRRVQIIFSLSAEIKGLNKWKSYEETCGNQVFTSKDLGRIATKSFLRKIQKMDGETAKAYWLKFLNP
jgi:hypothetical protein